jgi:hypothetical protein
MTGIWGSKLRGRTVIAKMGCGGVNNRISLHGLSISKSIFHPYITEFPPKINPEKYLKCMPLYKCQAVKTTTTHNCWLQHFDENSQYLYKNSYPA